MLSTNKKYVSIDNVGHWMKMTQKLEFPRRSHFSFMVPPNLLCDESTTHTTSTLTTSNSETCTLSTTSFHIETTEKTVTSMSTTTLISTTYTSSTTTSHLVTTEVTRPSMSPITTTTEKQTTGKSIFLKV